MSSKTRKKVRVKTLEKCLLKKIPLLLFCSGKRTRKISNVSSARSSFLEEQVAAPFGLQEAFNLQLVSDDLLGISMGPKDVKVTFQIFSSSWKSNFSKFLSRCKCNFPNFFGNR